MAMYVKNCRFLAWFRTIPLLGIPTVFPFFPFVAFWFVDVSVFQGYRIFTEIMALFNGESVSERFAFV